MRKLLSLFKTPTKTEAEIKLNIFRRKLIDQSGFSDNTFNQLIEPFLPLVAKYDLFDHMSIVLKQVVHNESLHRSGKKQAFFIAFCLLLTNALVKNRDPEYLRDDEQLFVEIVTVSVFHSLISRSAEGYKWINSSRTLVKDAWIFLKAGKGRFADVLIIPHDENNGVSEAYDFDSDEIDLDEGFTSDTEVEISSLLSVGAEGISDLDVLNRLGADDSSGPSFNEDIVDKPVGSEVEVNGERTTDGNEREPSLLDISSLIDNK